MPLPISPRLRSLRTGLAVAAAGAALVLAGFGVGAAVFEFEIWPYATIHHVFDAASRRSRPSDRVIRTQFVSFDVRQADYGFPKTGRQHGAFAVVDGAPVVLINQDLALLDPETLERTPLAIGLPDNGREALLARADADTPPFYVRYNWHRYHDIVYQAPFLYLTYSDYDEGDACVRSVLTRLRITGLLRGVHAAAEDWERMVETAPCLPIGEGVDGYSGHQAGGRLAVAADGALLWTVGDYGQDGVGGPPVSQDPAADYGKVWRVDPATGAATVFSVGHRNPQGLAVAADGTVWATEHGPEGGDELNRLEPGADYGWPRASYGVDYGTRAWPGARRQGRHDGFAEPAWAWTPSIGVAELTEVAGLHPTWDGDLLVSSLQARSLYRVRTAGARVVTIETIPLGDRIRDVEVVRGRLFLVTDNGDVLRLTPRADPDAPPRLAGIGEAASRELATCLTCHGGGRQPALCGVLGRPVGAAPGASEALREAPGRWDRRRLAAFLADTEAALPGIAMPRVAIPDPAVRAELVDHLDVFCG